MKRHYKDISVTKEERRVSMASSSSPSFLAQPKDHSLALQPEFD